MVRRPFSRPYRRAKTAREGAAAVEFALVGPILVFLLIGIVVYGGWFLMAQSVQALASEGARAAIAGLDPTEREALARSFITTQVGDMGLQANRASVEVESTAGVIRVKVAYDVRDHPLMALAAIVPSPPRVIRRTLQLAPPRGRPKG